MPRNYQLRAEIESLATIGYVNYMVSRSTTGGGTATDLQDMLSRISALEKQDQSNLYTIVNQLPATGVENTIYIVPDASSGTATMHIWVNGAYQDVGAFTPQVDTSDMVTTDDLNQAITTSNNALQDYVDNAMADSVAQAMNDAIQSGITAPSYDATTLYDPVNNPTGIKLDPGKIIMLTTATTQYQSGVTIPGYIKSDGTYTYFVDASEMAAHAAHDLSMFQDIVNRLTTSTNSLNDQIAQINMRMDNKVLSDQQIDIETPTQSTGGWTVPANNGLGGKIAFEGIDALLANTGVVYVNGIIIWDNRGALGLQIGTPQDTAEVMDGDVIETSGLNTIFYTPYVPAP